jgi:hypothetical protein
LTVIPEDIRKILAQRAGPAMLALITNIRTSYKGQAFDEHSGTGLLVTNQFGQTFCLTANHVVTPSSRTSPDNREVVQHTYCENLGRADEFGRIFLEDNSPIPPPFRLRRKYFKSESCDLAIPGSCLNGFVLPGIRRKNYYPYDYLANANFHEIFNEDVFAVCGFPEKLTTTILASREVIHSPLLHLFTGSQCANHSLDFKRYILEYANANPSPHGMSGAPVWLLRESTSPAAPLDFHQVRNCYERGDPIHITSWFAGVVVSHEPTEGRIQVIRPEVCAEFATKAEQDQLALMDPDEDKIIEEQIDYWMERYGHKWLSN